MLHLAEHFTRSENKLTLETFFINKFDNSVNLKKDREGLSSIYNYQIKL